MFLSWLNIHITHTCFTLKAITLLKTTVDTIVDMANENVNIFFSFVFWIVHGQKWGKDTIMITEFKWTNRQKRHHTCTDK
jgi:hypothetical protein